MLIINGFKFEDVLLEVNGTDIKITICYLIRNSKDKFFNQKWDLIKLVKENEKKT